VSPYRVRVEVIVDVSLKVKVKSAISNQTRPTTQRSAISPPQRALHLGVTHSISRISGLDVSRDLSRRAKRLGATTGDLDLRARDVELGRGAGVVDAELLDAEEVLTRSDARGDGDGVSGYDACQLKVLASRHMCGLQLGERTFQVPLGLSAVECRADFFNLGPVRGAVGCCGAVNFGHVEADWALVVDGLVCGEGYGGSSGD
jgi:hypothetical protein